MKAAHCIKCGNNITERNSVKYCTNRCQRLYLKAQYKKRYADKINQYSRAYRKPRFGGNAPLSNPARYRADKCLRCSAEDRLQVAHVKPLGAGGTHAHTVTFCQPCHYQFDTLLRNFWFSIVA